MIYGEKKGGVPGRFWSKVSPGGPADCWLWTARLNAKGYAVFWDAERKQPVGAHRWLWERLHGELGDGAQIDHLCRVRHCVNPEHMEPVTCRTNLMRGETIARKWAARHGADQEGKPDRIRGLQKMLGAMLPTTGTDQ